MAFMPTWNSASSPRTRAGFTHQNYKGDLGLRPVFHHKEERVQAHLLVCFLALTMWRSLELWPRARGRGDTARQVVQEVSTIHSMDVVLSVRERTETRLCTVGKPEPLAADLLARLGLKLPPLENRAKCKGEKLKKSPANPHDCDLSLS